MYAPHPEYVSLHKAVAPAPLARPSVRAVVAPKAPSIRKKYHGKVVFAVGVCGQQVLVKAQFPELPPHPDYDANIQTFLAAHPGEPGKLYQFDGTYMLFKNGHPSFSGRLAEVQL